MRHAHTWRLVLMAALYLIGFAGGVASAQTCDYYPLTTCAQNILGKKTFYDGIEVPGGITTDGGQAIGGNLTVRGDAGISGKVTIAGALSAQDAGFNFVTVGSDLTAGDLITPYWYAPGVNGLFAYSVRGQADPDADLTVSGPRDPSLGNYGSIQTWGNSKGVMASIDGWGSVHAGSQYGEQAGAAAFWCDSSASGAICLECVGSGNLGCYTPIIGGILSYATDSGIPYGGRHGALNVGNANFMDAGWLIEADNGNDGFAKKFAVDFRGGIIQPSPVPLANFDQCGYTLVLLDAGDPGVIAHGQHYLGQGVDTLRYDSESNSWMYCNGAIADAGLGGWDPLCSPTNGGCDTRYAVSDAGRPLVSDKITLSNGTGTATVVGGAICTCTDTTANASVKCTVTSTTLTATGTGSDVIAYICL